MNQNIFDTILTYTSKAPVDVFGLANALGIEVTEKFLDDERSGCIEKGQNGYIITVNKSHSPARQRFTVAHELGHYIFHGDLIEQGTIKDDKLYRDARVGGIHEAQANKFAANLLMPDKLIFKLLASGINTIPELARALKVSEHAMRIRAESLGMSGEEPLTRPGARYNA